MAPESKLQSLIREYVEWDTMVTTGVNAAGQRVEVSGHAVLAIRPLLLAAIGRAAVEAYQAGALDVAAEREACALIAEQHLGGVSFGEDIAAEIRAREEA